jgi:SAM-dependent methyltransferase
MLSQMDRDLAQRYGPYASYTTDDDPVILHYGDNHVSEMDRLLDQYVGSGAHVLELGCGAGFTLCRLAHKTASVWGMDMTADLLEAARLRVREQNLTNVTLTFGDTTVDGDVAKLPDNHFTLAFSRRGPNIHAALLSKLTADAYYVQELVGQQNGFGLQELFGRKPFLPSIDGGGDGLIRDYAGIGLLPVSSKSYWYEMFFRDANHLEAYIRKGAWLSNWRLEPKPYEAERDRAALDLYVRYNTTAQGIRLLGHRWLYVFRRADVHYYPVDRVP